MEARIISFVGGCQLSIINFTCGNPGLMADKLFCVRVFFRPVDAVGYTPIDAELPHDDVWTRSCIVTRVVSSLVAALR
jgi:hypothetical protein